MIDRPRRHVVIAVTLAAGAVAGSPTLARAHPGAPLEPHDVWRAWTADAWIIIPIVILVAAYAVGVIRIWKSAGRGRGVSVPATVSFMAAIVALLVALVSPLHALSEALFSAHMVQHELLMLVAAPLLVLARPDLAALWAMPPAARARALRFMEASGLSRAWDVTCGPWVAWSVHAVLLWLWHAPALFDATLRSDFIHGLQHASFFGSGFIFWWSMVRGRHKRARNAVALISLFTTALHTTVLGVLLTVANEAWYAGYAATATAWSLTPLEDQQLGGLIMWVPGGMVYAAAALVFLARMLREPRVAGAARTTPGMRTAATASVLALLLLGACREHTPEADARGLTGGDPAAGARAIRTYGCPACHVIPGIKSAVGKVGPPLTGIASRHYIAGVLPNTPDNMVKWIEDPPKVDSLTAMPKLGVSRETARDIAAYLYTLR